jgi:mRNA-degrading endonuclease RelE of RelBE toxin-antitoxin system
MKTEADVVTAGGAMTTKPTKPTKPTKLTKPTKRPPAGDYGIVMSKALEGKLSRCRSPIRTAIRSQLHDIAVAAGESRKAIPKVTSKVISKMTSKKDPPHRFYVYEGYRVFYQVDAGTRRVVILDLGPVGP